MHIAGKGVLPARAEIGIQAMDGQVHLGHAPSAFVQFLSIDGDRCAIFVVSIQELLSLHEHAAGTAGRVVDAPAGRLQDLHQDADHAGRSVELSAALALGTCELLQEVFINFTEQVARTCRTLAGEASGVQQIQ